MEDVNKHNIFTELRSPNILERVMTEYIPHIHQGDSKEYQVDNYWGMAQTISRYIDWPQDKLYPFIMQHSFAQGLRSGAINPPNKDTFLSNHKWAKKIPKFKPLFWIWSKAVLESYLSYYPDHPFKTFALGNPLIYAENSFKGERKGTLVLPENLLRPYSESDGKRIIALRDYEPLLKVLENLPDKFHPIDICLRFDDIEYALPIRGPEERVKSYISELESRGFNLVCVGFNQESYFQERQLTLLSQYEYACVDHYLNSSKAYALYAGCKFFHPGDLTWDSPLNPKWWYKGKVATHLGTMEHIPPDELNPWGRPIYHKGKELFHLDNVEWSHKDKKAKSLINWCMGIDCKRTPEEILKLIEEEVILC